MAEVPSYDHAGGHKPWDVSSETEQADGTWIIKYDNGDTQTISATGETTGSAVKPDANWTPPTGNADNGKPWDATNGSQPPLAAPPAIPGGTETPGKGVTIVSVEAIRNYATNIDALLPTIRGSIKELDDLGSKGFGAGNFGAANNFKSKVFGGDSGAGAGTLLTSTRAVFVEAETIIMEISARCREIAQKYKTADELTELDAEEFGKMVTGVSSKVNSLPLGAAG